MWQHLRSCLDNASASREHASKGAIEQNSTDGKSDGKRPLPLSFVVVVPGWTEGDCWASLSTSPYPLRTPLEHAAIATQSFQNQPEWKFQWRLRIVLCCARLVVCFTDVVLMQVPEIQAHCSGEGSRFLRRRESPEKRPLPRVAVRHSNLRPSN